MKRHVILLATAIAVFTTSNGVAQQQRANAQQQHAHLRAMAHPGPMSAAAYEVKVQKGLNMLRAMRPFGPVTQSDINQAILLGRDCASTVEADGVVTDAEFKYCDKVMNDFYRQKLHELLVSSSPDEWKAWAQQGKANAASACRTH